MLPDSIGPCPPNGSHRPWCVAAPPPPRLHPRAVERGRGPGGAEHPARSRV